MVVNQDSGRYQALKYEKGGVGQNHVIRSKYSMSLAAKCTS